MPSFGIAFSPHGVPRLDALAEGAAPLDASIETAFAKGAGHGVLALAALSADQELAPEVQFLRELARLFLAAACKVPELESQKDATIPPPTELEAWRLSVPPMTGAEYLTEAAARALFDAVAAAFRAEWKDAGGTLERFLARFGSLFHLVGRVCFHLAENKRDEDVPFAFLATYTTKVSANERLKHLPLRKALDEYAGARNKGALLSLLAPIQRAAEESALLRAMVDSEEIYHPLAWTPAEALAFLKEAPAFEASGIVLRLPDWWRAKGARPEVKVSVGARPPSKLGQDALLDFSVEVALDGAPLTEDEREPLRRSTAGLVSLRGKWVEVDREKLDAVLAHWKEVEASAGRDGISFLEGMRLLAGADIAPSEAASVSDDVRAWSSVGAGEWLRAALSGAREAAQAIDPGPELHATLRPYQREGVRWLCALTALRLGACLADDMGLGKTMQVLALLLLVKRGAKARGPSLLVVPASLLGNWKAEARAVRAEPPCLHRPPLVHPERAPPSLGAKDLAATDVVLTTYGSLLRLGALSAIAWELVVLDEAQAIKNPGAKQTRAVKALDASAAPRAHRHARREPPRRPLVPLRLPRARPARQRQAVRSLHPEARQGPARLRAAPQPGEAVPPPAPQDRQDHRPGPARQDRGQGLLRRSPRSRRSSTRRASWR